MSENTEKQVFTFKSEEERQAFIAKNMPYFQFKRALGLPLEAEDMVTVILTGAATGGVTKGLLREFEKFGATIEFEEGFELKITTFKIPVVTMEGEKRVLVEGDGRSIFALRSMDQLRDVFKDQNHFEEVEFFEVDDLNELEAMLPEKNEEGQYAVNVKSCDETNEEGEPFIIASIPLRQPITVELKSIEEPKMTIVS